LAIYQNDHLLTRTSTRRVAYATIDAFTPLDVGAAWCCRMAVTRAYAMDLVVPLYAALVVAGFGCARRSPVQVSDSYGTS
jgi:hypothetical protein